MGLGIEAMGTVAHTVAALPGAVTHIPAIPSAAFALALAGGLWLVLWQRRWRLAGLPIIEAGLALAPATIQPEILIGREGALIAVRDSDGRPAAHAERPLTFELIRWLERDGDARDPKEARKSKAFRCDALGCTTPIPGATLSVSRHPGSVTDDCACAKILIVLGDAPAACDGPALILDRQKFKRSGTVAITRDLDGTYRTRSVAVARGLRPWSTPPPPPSSRSIAEPAKGPRSPYKQPPAPGDGISNNIGRFAAPKSIADAFNDWPEFRPEVEDDDP